MRQFQNRVMLKGQFGLEFAYFVEHVFHESRILRTTKITEVTSGRQFCWQRGDYDVRLIFQLKIGTDIANHFSHHCSPAIELLFDAPCLLLVASFLFIIVTVLRLILVLGDGSGGL